MQERRKLFSHWLLNVTSSVIGLSHNLSQSQPSQQFAESNFLQARYILPHRWENKEKSSSAKRRRAVAILYRTLKLSVPNLHLSKSTRTHTHSRTHSLLLLALPFSRTSTEEEILQFDWYQSSIERHRCCSTCPTCLSSHINTMADPSCKRTCGS